MRVTFHVERLTDVMPEWKLCLDAQWRENGKFHDAIPLDPDFAQYLALDSMGALSMIVARDQDGGFVGYLLAIVNSHLHHKSTRFAHVDIFWMDPRFRRGINGFRLFSEFEAEMRRLGVRQVVGHSAIGSGPDSSAIYLAMGYQHVEAIFMKAVK